MPLFNPYSTVNTAASTNSVGPPTTGTHVVGEVYNDGQGTLWVCVATGTPGSWNSASPGAIIDASSAFSLITSNATTLATGVEVGLGVSPTCTGDPIDFYLQAPMINSTGWVAGNSAQMSVCDVTGGATPATSNEVMRIRTDPQSSAGILPLSMTRRIIPPAGSRVYKAYMYSSASTMTASFNPAIAGNVGILPGILRVSWAT